MVTFCGPLGCRRCPKKRYEKLVSNQILSLVGDGMWPEKDRARALKSDA